MHIQLEAHDNNSIRSYTNAEITVNNQVYKQSVIIGKNEIIADWPIHSVSELTLYNLESLLQLDPEIILIGHQESGIYVPMPIKEYLSQRRIGIECMSLGAACRTFNVLLSEHRKVVVAIIFKEDR